MVHPLTGGLRDEPASKVSLGAVAEEGCAELREKATAATQTTESSKTREKARRMATSEFGDMEHSLCSAV